MRTNGEMKQYQNYSFAGNAISGVKRHGQRAHHLGLCLGVARILREPVRRGSRSLGDSGHDLAAVELVGLVAEAGEVPVQVAAFQLIRHAVVRYGSGKHRSVPLPGLCSCCEATGPADGRCCWGRAPKSSHTGLRPVPRRLPDWRRRSAFVPVPSSVGASSRRR
jgi:hypothetical protein